MAHTQSPLLVVWTVLATLLLNITTQTVLSWSPTRTSGARSSRILSSPFAAGMGLTSTTLYSSINNNTLSAGSTPSVTRWVSGPDPATKPDYDNIHGPLGSFLDNIFLRVFRGKLADRVGFDSPLPQVGVW
jgi:hypothetical protein